MFALYITHPQVNIDPDIPVPRWGLSEKGRARAELTAHLPWVRQLQAIVSSDETKAIETAEILAGVTGLGVQVVDHMGENDRSATGYLREAAFQTAADWFFAHPYESYRGWERAIDAQTRIVTAVKNILKHHNLSQPVAFVGHGGVGTLLKCHLENRPIARSNDQPGGGGNLFAFSLATLRIACDWTPMETWEGWQNGKSGA